MTETPHPDIPVNPSGVACLDLVNSAFPDSLGVGASVDRVGSPTWRRWFLDRYELGPNDAGHPPLDDLIALRTDLRRILEKWAGGKTLSSHDTRPSSRRTAASVLRHRFTAGPGGMQLDEEPLQRDWTWVLARVAASAVELMVTGDPKRLKTCTNPSCSWMFYDETVNHSKRYC